MTTNEKLNQILKTQDVQTLTTMINDGVELNEVELIDVLKNLVNNKDEVKADSRFIKMLIENGVQIDTTTNKSSTSSLMLLSYLGLDEIIEDFISKGFDINAKNIYGMNAFHWAVAKGEYSTAKLLMENGADIFAKAEFEVSYSNWDDITDDNGIKLEEGTKKIQVSSFGFAFNTYNPKIIQLLLEKGFDPNEDVMSENSLFHFLQDEPTSSYYINNNPVSEICKKNDTELLKLMIEKGANRFDTSDLAVACKNLNFEMIKLLVENGVEINLINESDSVLEEIPFDIEDNPLSVVCQNSTVEPSGKCAANLNILGSEVLNIIEYLIENGADVNIDSPLMAACSLDYSNLITPFQDNRPQNKHYADVNLDIIKLLIEKGANVNHINYDGTSILMEAMNRMNGFELARILIENGADVNHKNNSKNTCTHLIIDEWYHKEEWNEDNAGEMQVNKFSESNGEKILQLLIDNGADINTKNNMGMTPLMHYALKGEERLVKILLENGADINAKSEMTAFDLAGSEDIKTLIKDTKNNNPQKLVKLLSNFTIDTPFKLTTHLWEDPKGELLDRYGSFDGYMNAVKKQFESIKSELNELSSNLYKKISSFLIETTPDDNYSWCTKTPINIGWSRLEGLKEHCDSGKLPKDFKLPKPIFIGRKQIATFGEVVDLFKQEIEVRAGYKIPNEFNIEVSKRDFYTDTQKFSSVLGKIFSEMKKRVEHPQIEVTSKELEDRSIEIKICQVGSFGDKNSQTILEEVNDGDFKDIKESLTNLCDWSIESGFEDEHFRVNYLHSNNVKDIEMLESKPKGFTHILRFYK